MANYSLALSLAVILLLLTAPAKIDCEWSFAPQSAGHFNSPKVHNLGGLAAYQAEKNSFTIGAHSSVHPSGAKIQAFNGAFSTANNDGRNFRICGGVQDSSFGHSYMYKQHGGINFDVQHSQMKDNFGNRQESNHVGVSHTFRNGLNVNAGHSQFRDNTVHTSSLGGSYTTPSGMKFDAKHSQMKDSFGNRQESSQDGDSHTFRNAGNCGYNQEGDRDTYKILF
jgi:hypothetical protein